MPDPQTPEVGASEDLPAEAESTEAVPAEAEPVQVDLQQVLHREAELRCSGQARVCTMQASLCSEEADLLCSCRSALQPSEGTWMCRSGSCSSRRSRWRRRSGTSSSRREADAIGC